MRSPILCLWLVAVGVSCSNEGPNPSDGTSTTVPVETPAKAAVDSPPVPPPSAPQRSGAQVGAAAPDFTLVDTEGKEVTLASFKGKTVVLEWYNPECPYVVRSHTNGSLKGMADRVVAEGAVWLVINSGAPGKQGAGAEKSKEGAGKLGIRQPILLDESGAVGKRYGATNTPHMYVIDPEGTLAYAGAIDNSPDGEGESPEGGTLVNYVAEALTALREKKPVAVPETKAYGCSVKYGN